MLTSEDYFIKNKSLIASIVKNLNGGIFDEDLFQEGSIGLLKAIKKFDNNNGAKFSTYATHWIKREIRRAIENRCEIFKKEQNNLLEDKTSNNDQIDKNVILKEQWSNFIKGINEKDLNILQMKENGLNQQEISYILGISQKSVSLRIKKIKEKWKNFSA